MGYTVMKKPMKPILQIFEKRELVFFEDFLLQVTFPNVKPLESFLFVCLVAIGN